MSEYISELAPSPYVRIFKMIEAVPDCTTFQAYELYREEIERCQLDPSMYLSMAITSGGYARDTRLKFDEILARNGSYGTLIAQALTEQYFPYIETDDIVVPSDLGKVATWGQADYLLFWAHVLTGLDTTEAKVIDLAVRESGAMHAPGFYDKALPREERWASYKQLVDTYVEAFKNTQAGQGLHGANVPRNMQAVILVLDAAESLGVNAERYLCDQLGLGEYSCDLVKVDGPAAQETRNILNLGADVMRFGDTGTISGRVNTNRARRLKEMGVRFRKSGILDGIVGRKQAANIVPPSPQPQRSSEELWKEYFMYN